MPTLNLPHHPPTDLLICGSTLAACDLAIQSARAGLQTTLAMEKVNPFFEGVSCLRSWIDLDPEGPDPTAFFPELLRPVLENPKVTERIGQRLYFNPSMAIQVIEDALCDSGVRFFYNTAPAMALRQGDHLTGVVFGGKSGLFAIPAKAIVDGTPSATLAQVMGLPFDYGRFPGSRVTGEPQPVHSVNPEGRSHRRLHYSIELSKPVASRTCLYEAAGLTVHAEVHQRYISFTVDLGSRPSTTLGEIDDFRAASSAVLAFPLEKDEVRFRGADGWIMEGNGAVASLDNTGRVSMHPNLFITGPGARPGERNPLLTSPASLVETTRSLLPHITSAIRNGSLFMGDGMVRATLGKARAPGGISSRHTPSAGEKVSPIPNGETLGITDPGFEEPGATWTDVEMDLPDPILEQHLVIAGAGTSGIAAAWQAGNLKIPAICIDRGLEPGGTNTLGGVTNLWYGTDSPAFRHFYETIGASNNGLNAVAFAKALDQVGVPFYPGLAFTGVAHRGGRITRVLAIGPQGLVSISGNLFIDATGDGCLAAWAGAPYAFGGMEAGPSRMDETTLWGSFAYFKAGAPEARRPFLSPCDERSPADATRFIIAMRRNAKVAFDILHTPPPFYLAPRESRHILGGTTVSYLDVLAGRKYARGIFRARSNLDIKGIATSAAARAGFIPEYWLEVFAVTVPYDALVPPSLANVIIAGKAYSIHHDALAMARMQKDLFVMGMAAAEAAALAGKSTGRFADVPVADLQSRLIAMGALLPEDIASDDFGFETDPGPLVAEIASAPSLDKALIPSARLALARRQRALAALAACPEKNNENLARIRCFLGDKEGARWVLSDFTGKLGEGMPPQAIYCGKAATPHIMPDQGYGPLPALLLGNLTASGTEAAGAAIQVLGPKIDVSGFEYNARWGYLFAIANACEASPSARWIPWLEHFLKAPELCGILVHRGQDPRLALDPMKERHGYLRLALARALARCGSAPGREALAQFQDEVHVAWARSARRVLAEVSTATGA